MEFSIWSFKEEIFDTCRKIFSKDVDKEETVTERDSFRNAMRKKKEELEDEQVWLANKLVKLNNYLETNKSTMNLDVIKDNVCAIRGTVSRFRINKRKINMLNRIILHAGQFSNLVQGLDQEEVDELEGEIAAYPRSNESIEKEMKKLVSVSKPAVLEEKEEIKTIENLSGGKSNHFDKYMKYKAKYLDLLKNKKNCNTCK